MSFPANVAAPSATTPPTLANATNGYNAATVVMTPAPTCCVVRVNSVRFNYWWSTSYEVTVATVITNYVQYRDTVLLGNVTTVYNHSATSDLYGASHFRLLPGVPTDLASSGNGIVYGTTSFVSGIAATIDTFWLNGQTKVMTSPAAFALFPTIGIYTGTPVQTSLGGSYVCYTEAVETYWGDTTVNRVPTYEAYTTSTIPHDPVVSVVQIGSNLDNAPIGFHLDPVFVYVNDSITSNLGNAQIPQTMIDYLESLPSVTEVWPYITSCAFEGGEGAPSVHIAVNELTDTQSATVTVNRNAPDIRTSSSAVARPTPASNLMPSPESQPYPVPERQPESHPAPTGSTDSDAPPTEAKISITVAGFQGSHDGPSDNENSIDTGNSGRTGTGNSNSANSVNSAGMYPDQEPQRERLPTGSGVTLGPGGSKPASNTDAGYETGGYDSVGSGPTNEGYTPSQSGGEGSNNQHSESDTDSGAQAANGFLSLLDAGSGSDGQHSETDSAPPNSKSSLSGPGSDPDSSSGGGDTGVSSARIDALLSDALGSNVILPIGSSRYISALVAPSGGIVLPNSQTLTAGYATTYSGVSISLPPNQPGAAIPSAVVIGSGSKASTVPLAAAGAITSSPTTVDIGGQYVTISWAPSGGGIILPDGKTLSVGHSTDINGVPISLAPNGDALVEGSSTIPLSAPISKESLTIGSSVLPISYAPNNQGIILFNGQTLHPGEATTISGTTLSLALSETAVVVNGKTEALNPPASTIGVGGYVASGIGAGGAAGESNTIANGAPGSTVQAAGSAADSSGERNNIWVAFAMSLFAILIVR
ncbi:MAG: hypothetical protein M1820_001842 [Bogoriella megaspora]|nr:MAG: hypothetical protein M1820_001842 [Bogoriella megaspora]